MARRTGRLVAATAALLVAATSAAAGAAPGPRSAGAASGSAPCRYPGNVKADRWNAMTTPDGATPPVSVQQLDQDPCDVIAADKAGKRWRSEDAGAHWSLADGTATPRVVTERMQPRARGGALGPVLAVGPVAKDTGVPQVYVSDDDGRTFAASTIGTQPDPIQPPPIPWPVPPLIPIAPTPPPVDTKQPLAMDVSGAVTAVHYTKGVPHPYVYVAGRFADPKPGTEVAPRLLKSNDGGHTFGPVAGAQSLAPTVVAVNPTGQDELWVNDLSHGSGGGAWVSYDGGTTFAQACCADATVRDISVTAAPNGGIVVLLATDKGLLRSLDDGRHWETVVPSAVTAVRTPADDPGTMLVANVDTVVWATGDGGSFTGMRGLPVDCRPEGLRRDDRVPSTFLVRCASTGTTYRLLLTKYGGTLPDPDPDPDPIPDPNPVGGTGRQLAELAEWQLPGSDTWSGTIAFDGTVLYYDLDKKGHIGRVRATDGEPLPDLKVAMDVESLTVDLRRNELIITGIKPAKLYAYDIDSGKTTEIGKAVYHVPSYDAWGDGLSWVPEGWSTMFRRGYGESGKGKKACDIFDDAGFFVTVGGTSTFVASGDGGGYIQNEDDATLVRIDRTCRVLDTFQHRTFSESGNENDAMACDTQTFFPQPAIWIRDSEPGTVTAYGVPFGYCPMPSALRVSGPRTAYGGSAAPICATLANATDGRAGADRGVTISVDGRVAGHGQTDARGRMCLTYVAPLGGAARRQLKVTAAFSGDSALYPSSARDGFPVLNAPPPPPPPPVPQPPAVVPPVPPPPPPPPPPPNPPAQPNPQPGPVQAPQPNPGQVPQAQMQPQAQPMPQGVVVPQRQQQPQLALAHAAKAIEQENAMVAPARRRRAPLDPPVVAALLAMGSAAVAAAARHAPAYARRRP
jgi:hypothetical protein